MEDGVDVVARDGLGDEVFIAVVAFHEGDAFRHRPSKAGGKIVENDRLFAPVEEFENRMAADVAGPACHQNSHPFALSVVSSREINARSLKFASIARSPNSGRSIELSH